MPDNEIRRKSKNLNIRYFSRAAYIVAVRKKSRKYQRKTPIFIKILETLLKIKENKCIITRQNGTILIYLAYHQKEFNHNKSRILQS